MQLSKSRSKGGRGGRTVRDRRGGRVLFGGKGWRITIPTHVEEQIDPLY